MEWGVKHMSLVLYLFLKSQACFLDILVSDIQNSPLRGI